MSRRVTKAPFFPLGDAPKSDRLGQQGNPAPSGHLGRFRDFVGLAAGLQPTRLGAMHSQ